MTDQPADRTRPQVTVHNAVLHMANDQPLVADLFGVPEPHHTGLVCTNLRTLAGKRPIFADDSHSTFFFPWTQIRFLEIRPVAGGPALLEAPAADAVAPPPDIDLEIDEDFLRRVRDV